MTKGHNNPPNPIDEATAPYGDAIQEAQNWLDGEPVQDESQMKAVDALTKQIKAAIKDVTAGQKSESAPHFDAHKAAIARWKPTIDDLKLLSTGLVACVAKFKQHLADQKAADRNAAWEKANAARLEAERKVREANASDIEAQREAQAAQQAAIDADNAARSQAKDTVKGMRKVHKYDIVDHKAVINFIAVNFRGDMTAFIEEWVRINHKTVDINGVEQSIEKEAY